MARVYSWEVSNSPKKYAYIVHPTDFTIAYIGNELYDSDLERVATWASTCTDAEYQRQFELVKQLCETQNLNVQFEDVAAYINVTSSCDNLRGPAGRGISYIALTHQDTVQMTDTYTIFYDDGTTDSFFINHGKPGRDGVDGTPGAKGDDPVSTCFKMIYASGADADGNLITHKNERDEEVAGPSRPKGGSYEFLTNKFTAPEGWSVSDSGLNPPIWMSSRTFTSSTASTDNNWSSPVQITGENGKPGEDGLNSEFIYIISPNKPDRPTESKNEAGFVPGNHDVDDDGNPIYAIGTWTPSPIGVDEDNTTEWSCIRRLKKVVNEVTKEETKVWGDWEEPAIWSKYGVNGQDGDGVQYMYIRNKGQFPQNPTPTGYNTIGSDWYEAYQNKDNEWLPPVGEEYKNIKGKDVKYTAMSDDIAVTGETDENGNTVYPAGIWTDNPTDVSVDYQYQWVCTRKYKSVEKEIDNKIKIVKEWTAYSDPSLWGKFGEQGKSGTVIRKLYCLTENTKQVPSVPKNSVETVDWSSGFPKDYVNGENVVWGTEAELWAHNNEFVTSYMLVSYTNEEGVVIKPDKIITEEDKESNPEITGVTNCITLSYLPDEQYKDSYDVIYKYVCFEGQYYEWKSGGWCEPYLVSGMKGEDAKAIDYVTTAFVYGYMDYVPERPNFSSPITLGSTSSIGTNLDPINWEDYPNINKSDTNIGIEIRIDGAVDKDGYKRRWYQCQGQVDGYKGEIKKDGDRYLWGEVSPNSPKDGESIMGPYTEYRFAVTESENAPTILDTVNGMPNRTPVYYNDANVQCGWFLTSDFLPKIPTGGAMWMTYATISGETDTLVANSNGKYWSTPTRVSGEKGEDGLPGPTGLRGTTGIPGASQNTLYCLGTDSAKKNDYYFEGENENTPYGISKYVERLIVDGKSKGYFGDNIDGIKSKEINNWYKGTDLPYSTATEIEVALPNAANQSGLTEDNITNAKEISGGKYIYQNVKYIEIESKIKTEIANNEIFDSVDIGGVIRVLISTSETKGGDRTYDNVYHQYYLKTYDFNEDKVILKAVSRILTVEESEDFCIYVWGIQGNDIVERNVSGLYERNKEVAFVKGSTNVFSGNTQNVVTPPDPKINNKYTQSDSPEEYNGKKYIYASESGFFYKWGRIDAPLYDPSTGNLISNGYYGNIKVRPNVVDINSCVLMSSIKDSLKSEDITTVSGVELPKHKVTDTTDSNNPVSYEYVIDDTDGIIGENDCYKWRQFDGDAVDHKITGVNWGSPFKLQGTNGLRGLEGTRGQVIYPMGEYNQEEVYICTAEKAPYVYDPNDSLFYVLDKADAPWVGQLPKIEDGEHFDLNYYKCVTVPPADYIGNYVTYTEYDPNTGKNDPLTSSISVSMKLEYPDGSERDAKYLRIENYRDVDNKETGEGVLGGKYANYVNGRIIDAFFECIKNEDGTQGFRVAHSYKYKWDKGWMTDQDGATPSGHYANLKEDNRVPYWTRFETFQALYASVGIIANGLIGSAVFNNEFMFSQQGMDYAGNESEYKTVSSIGYKYGFLSGYEYDEEGVNINNHEYHWRYSGTRYYLKESEVDPYQKVEVLNGYENSLVNTSEIKFGHATYGQDFNLIPSGDTGKKTNGEVCYINVHPIDYSEDIENNRNVVTNYLHTFMPNVCINFASGQMWLSTGEISFGYKSKNIYTCSESDLNIIEAKREVNSNISSAKTEMNLMNKLLSDWSSDGKISPSERKALKDEGQTILDEKDYYVGLASGLTGEWSVFVDSYKTANDNAVDAITYHTALSEKVKLNVEISNIVDSYEDALALMVGECADKLIYVTNDETLYKIEDIGDGVYQLNIDTAYINSLTNAGGGKYNISYIPADVTIDIKTGNTENGYIEKDYRYIKDYYRVRQTLLSAINNKMSADTLTNYTSFVNDEVEKLQNEITSATTSLTQTINTNKTQIQEQLDKRADMYYQSEDPSNPDPNDPSKKWQITNKDNVLTYAENRVGDIWYDTDEQRSYIFTNGVKGDNPGKECDNTNLTNKYFWADSYVSQTVFNTINTRSKVFIQMPHEDYHPGDLWFIEDDSYTGKTFTGGSGVTSGTCMVCISDGTGSGKDITTFTYSDWGKRDHYADEAMVNAAQIELEEMQTNLSDWASDDQISPSERASLVAELETIKAEYSQIYDQLENLNIQSSLYETYEDAYTDAVCAITYHTTLQEKTVDDISICGTKQSEEEAKTLATLGNKNKYVHVTGNGISELYLITDVGVIKKKYQNVVIKQTNANQTKKCAYKNDTDTIPIVRTGNANYEYIAKYYEERQKALNLISAYLNTGLIQATANTETIITNLNKWADDGFLNPDERTALKRDAEKESIEYSAIITRAGEVNANTTAYTNAYKKYTGTTEYYTSAATSDYTSSIEIKTTGTGVSNYNNIKDYYTAKNNLLTEIDKKLIQYSDEAIKTLKDELEDSIVDEIRINELIASASTDGIITQKEASQFLLEYDDFSSDFVTTLKLFRKYDTIIGYNNINRFIGMGLTVAQGYFSIICGEVVPGDFDETNNNPWWNHRPKIKEGWQYKVDDLTDVFNNIKDYYNFRNTYLQKVNEQIKNELNNLNTSLSNLEQTVGNIKFDTYLENVFGKIDSDTDGATLTGFLGVKDSKGNVINYINGSSDITYFDNEQIALSLGIPSTNNTLIEFYKYIGFIYNEQTKKYHTYTSNNYEDDVFYLNVKKTSAVTSTNNSQKLIAIQVVNGNKLSVIQGLTEVNDTDYVYILWEPDGHTGPSRQTLLKKNAINDRWDVIGGDNYHNGTITHFYVSGNNTAQSFMNRLGFPDGIGGDVEEHGTNEQQSKIFKIRVNSTSNQVNCVGAFNLISVNINGDTILLRRMLNNRGKNSTEAQLMTKQQYTGTILRKVNKARLGSTVMLSDGTIISNNIKLINGEYNGSINANGIFSGETYGSFYGNANGNFSGEINATGKFNGSLSTGEIYVDQNTSINSGDISANSSPTYKEINTVKESYTHTKSFKEYSYSKELDIFTQTLDSGSSITSIIIPKLTLYLEHYTARDTILDNKIEVKFFVTKNGSEKQSGNTLTHTFTGGLGWGNRKTGSTTTDTQTINLGGSTGYSKFRIYVKFTATLKDTQYTRNSQCIFKVSASDKLKVSYASEGDVFVICKHGIKFKKGTTTFVVGGGDIIFEHGNSGIRTVNEGTSLQLKLGGNYFHVGTGLNAGDLNGDGKLDNYVHLVVSQS